MGGIKRFIKSELTGWKIFDIIWLTIATAVILGLSIYWKDTWISLVAAVTGVWCVILTGKGKRSSFIFGSINTILYAIVAFKAKYYGEVMLNLIYYLPMNFVGWFVWKKHMNDETGEVIKQRLSLTKSIIVYIVTAIAIVIYGIILQSLGGNLPYIDSMSTVISVVAQILSIKRLMEQWILWIVVDIVTVIMWAVDFIKGGETIGTLAMWSVYLINAFIMFIRWCKESKKNEKEKEKEEKLKNENQEPQESKKNENQESQESKNDKVQEKSVKEKQAPQESKNIETHISLDEYKVNETQIQIEE